MKVVVANPPWETERGYGIRTNSRWPHVRPDNGSIDPELPFERYDSTGQIIDTGHISGPRLKELYNSFWTKFYLR